MAPPPRGVLSLAGRRLPSHVLGAGRVTCRRGRSVAQGCGSPERRWPHHDQSHPHLQQPRQAAALQVLPALRMGGAAPGAGAGGGRESRLEAFAVRGELVPGSRFVGCEHTAALIALGPLPIAGVP